MLVDVDKCIGCGACIPFCPADAITVFGTAYIDEGKCKECRICLSYCVVGAISEEGK